MAQIGDGFGQIVTHTPPPTQDIGEYRREKMIRTMVGSDEITIIVRDTVVPEDPLLNMMRATAYTWQVGRGAQRARFPVPSVGREIKDALIKTNIVV